MINSSAAANRLRRPELMNLLELQSRQYTMVSLSWDDQLDHAQGIDEIFNEIFSIMPEMPVIFPITYGMSLSFCRRIKAPNLVWVSVPDQRELNYLKCHSLAVIGVRPHVSEKGLQIQFDCTTNARRKKRKGKILDQLFREGYITGEPR